MINKVDNKINLQKISVSDYELGVTLGTGKTALININRFIWKSPSC